MPLYDYKCDKCGHIEDDFASCDNMEPKPCPKCGADSQRQFSPPNVVVPLAEKPGGYFDPQIGKWVTSQHQIREHAKRNNLELHDWPERNPISGEKYSKVGSLRQNPPPAWTGIPGI